MNHMTEAEDLKFNADIMQKLVEFVGQSLAKMAISTRLSLQEVLDILQGVDVRKLNEAAHEAFKEISYATDLDTDQIEKIMTDHRSAPLEDLVARLREKSHAERVRN